jgi:hypothetical protein
VPAGRARLRRLPCVAPSPALRPACASHSRVPRCARSSRLQRRAAPCRDRQDAESPSLRVSAAGSSRRRHCRRPCQCSWVRSPAARRAP